MAAQRTELFFVASDGKLMAVPIPGTRPSRFVSRNMLEDGPMSIDCEK
jgi:hypothetical protein